MAELYANNARSKLATAFGSSETELTILSGDGNALFPGIAGSDFYRCTLFKFSTGEIEIITVGARSGDTFSAITRAAENIGNVGATPIDFQAGDLIELRPTKGFFDTLSSITSTQIQSWAYNYAIAGGTTNAYTVSLSPIPATYAEPLPIMFQTGNPTAGGPVTIDVNGLGPVPIALPDGSEPIAGDIQNNKVALVVYDGVGSFTLMNPRASYTTGIAQLDAVNVFTEMQQFSQGVDIAISATDADIGIDGNFFQLSAAAAQDLHAFQDSLPAGTTFYVEFLDGNITLKHQATAGGGYSPFDIQGAADRIMVAGDLAKFVSRGFGENYHVTIQRADGQAVIVSDTTIRGSFRNLTVFGNASECDISADEIIVQNANGFPHRLTAYVTTCDTNFNGEGGLDAGTVAPDTWYYIYAIYDDVNDQTSVVCSTNSTAPVLAWGTYTHWGLIGEFLTDSSSEIIDFIAYNKDYNFRAPVIMYDGATTLTQDVWDQASIILSITPSDFIPVTAETINFALGAANSTVFGASGLDGGYGGYRLSRSVGFSDDYDGKAPQARARWYDFRDITATDDLWLRCSVTNDEITILVHGYRRK